MPIPIVWKMPNIGSPISGRALVVISQFNAHILTFCFVLYIFPRSSYFLSPFYHFCSTVTFLIMTNWLSKYFWFWFSALCRGTDEWHKSLCRVSLFKRFFHDVFLKKKVLNTKPQHFSHVSTEVFSSLATSISWFVNLKLTFIRKHPRQHQTHRAPDLMCLFLICQQKLCRIRSIWQEYFPICLIIMLYS